MTALTQVYSFAFNGQVFGGAGSPYQILSVDGLESLPGIRNQDDNRGYHDGMFTGRDFLSGRTISIIFNTFGDALGSAQTNYNTIQSTLLPQTQGTTPLYFKFPNSPTSEQFVNARVRALRTTVDANYTYGYITSQVDFFCPDPNYYNNNLQTSVMAFSPIAGRTYNRTFNYNYGGGSSVITTTISNIGWATTYPTITITGPITNPVVGDLTSGNVLNFTGTYSALDTLEIDLYNQLITLNGSPARNLLISGTWFDAPPGNSLYYFTGTGTLAGTTQATVSWYSAYI
jgi:phage-related protein